MFTQILINSIIAGSIYTLISLGFNLTYGASRFFNFSHGSFIIVGGYLVLFLSKTIGLNLILSMVLGLLITGILGLMTYTLIFSKLRQWKASNMVLLISSIGIFIIIQSVVAMLFSSKFQTLSLNIGNSRIYDLFGASISKVQIISVAASALITMIFFFILRDTYFGKTMRAVSDAEEIAKIVGIPTEKYIGYTFFIGAVLAGAAGIIIGLDTGIEPSRGFSYLLKGIAASIIGGVGNVYGGLLGSYFIGLLENFGIWKNSGVWKDTIIFLFLMIFLFIKSLKTLKK
ncbi:MAG: branched-chain amino acid ABC transporter permease [Leadbetterella sp.]|nr:branched-chain amino acid ABC transporter permease [Leadbetterella sp.]